MDTKVCPKCKIEKPIEDFGNRTGRKCQFYCKVCHSKYNSDWYKRNKERASANHRRVTRRTSLTSSNKRFKGLHKRVYPNHCEICGVLRERRLHYHHWDDSNPSRGIWICFYCHRLVEFYEKGLIASYLRKYLTLKQIVEMTVRPDNL